MSIGVKTSSQEEYTYHYGLEGFYTQFGTSINWFPEGVIKATGTQFGDSISASSYGTSLPFGSKGVTIDSGLGNDSITGSIHSDVIKAGAGDDTIIGSRGSDSIIGGAGNNVSNYTGVEAGSINDTYTLTKSERLDIKGLTFTGVSESSQFFRDSSNKNNLMINSDQGFITVKNFVATDSGATVTIGDKNLNDVVLYETVNPSEHKGKYTGTRLKDFIDGREYPTSPSAKGLTLDGGAGNDTIYGTSNNDTLKGGAGDDYLYGGDGNDSLIDTAGSNFLVGGAGNCSITSGAGNDVLYGGTGNDVLKAGAGDDTVYGGAGNDSIIGGTGVTKAIYDTENFGNDTYTVTKGETLDLSGLTFGEVAEKDRYTKKNNDLVIKSDKGNITIKNYLNKDTGAEVIVNGRNLKTTDTPVFSTGEEYFNPSSGKANAKFIGSSLSDSINAGSYSGSSSKGVSIDGGLGNDTIFGSSKADVLKGGAGDDYIHGGAGNDSIIGGSGVTRVVYTAESFGDDVYTPSKDETINISGLTFSEVAEKDRYTRKNNDLIIKSDKGSVTIKNLLGKDTGATVKINDENLSEVAKLGVGYDYFINSSGKLAHNKYTGTALADTIDAGSISSYTAKNGLVLDGGAGSDSIIGSNAGDKLYGGTGNDTINGRNGNDSIFGGVGSDSVYGGSGNDVIDGGEDDDILYGNTGNDSVCGGLGNDTIYGDDGDDTLIGGGGSDSVYGGAGNNLFKYSLNDGDDTVFYGGENANDTITFDKGIGVNLAYGENGSDLIINYSGAKGGKQYENNITVKDYAINHSLNSITVGKETKAVEEYFAKTNKSGSEFISTEKGEVWTNLNAGNHTFKYNIDNTGTKGNFGVDIISSANTYEIDKVETFAFGDLSVVKGEINMGFNSNTSTNDLGMKLGKDGSGELGHVYYRNFLATKPSMQLTDADHTYSVKGYTTAQTLDNSATETNNAVVINTTSDTATTITSNNKYNYTNVGGASALTYNYNGGHDVIRTDEQANSDTYNVVSALDNNTSLRIYEGGGNNDKLSINATATTVGIVFNVYQGVGETYNADLSRSVFTVRNSIDKDTIKEALAGADPSVANGIYVIDSSEENTGIEFIATSDHASDINEETWYNAIAESVGAWLATNGYESTEGAIDAYNKDNNIDLTGLVNAYKSVDYASLIS